MTRANQSVEATATCSPVLMAGPDVPRDVCGLRASPFRSPEAVAAPAMIRSISALSTQWGSRFRNHRGTRSTEPTSLVIRARGVTTWWWVWPRSASRFLCVPRVSVVASGCVLRDHDGADQTPGEATRTDSRIPLDPGYRCHPWCIPGLFLDHGLHGFHGWEGQRRRHVGPERANQSVEATATRSPGLMVEPGDFRGVCGRRASPCRSPTEAADRRGRGVNHKEHKERKETDVTARGMTVLAEGRPGELRSLCSLRSLWLVSSRSRANQSVEATATRALALMAESGDLDGVCGRRASPLRSAAAHHKLNYRNL